MQQKVSSIISFSKKSDSKSPTIVVSHVGFFLSPLKTYINKRLQVSKCEDDSKCEIKLSNSNQRTSTTLLPTTN